MNFFFFLRRMSEERLHFRSQRGIRPTRTIEESRTIRFGQIPDREKDRL